MAGLSSLYFPCASVLVLATGCIPPCSWIRMTSTPAAGLPLVPLLHHAGDGAGARRRSRDKESASKAASSAPRASSAPVRPDGPLSEPDDKCSESHARLAFVHSHFRKEFSVCHANFDVAATSPRGYTRR